MNHEITKQLVKKILELPLGGHRWSLQGLGMLRLYLSKGVRLHIWDSRFRVPNVSTIHDHPWEFDSYIVAGKLRQVRYVPHSAGEWFLWSTLHCGQGNCQRTPEETIGLKASPVEIYDEGDSYTQRRDEIHDSMPEDGTVTIITRRFTSKDEDHARVFWPIGQRWVSAEPRPATEQEVIKITQRALRWFEE